MQCTKKSSFEASCCLGGGGGDGGGIKRWCTYSKQDLKIANRANIEKAAEFRTALKLIQQDKIYLNSSAT